MMPGMDDEWAGADWSEAREQAFVDAWAVRIRDCPRPRCRRAGSCLGWRAGSDCVGMLRHPMPHAEGEGRWKLVKAVLARMGVEIRAGRPRPDMTAAVAAEKRRSALAAARAKAGRARRHPVRSANGPARLR